MDFVSDLRSESGLWMPKVEKAGVEEILRSHMARNGWPLTSLGRFPQAFARNTDVTPYFAPRVVSRKTFVMIDGYVGVFYSSFETDWALHHPDSASSNPWINVWFALNVANFPRLTGATGISDGCISQQVATVASSIAGVLEALPQDVNELKVAIRTDSFAGFPTDAYCLPHQSSRLHEFRTYLSTSK